MSHGIIHTRKHGLVHGVKHFSHPLATTTGWTKDATATTKGFPASNAEWLNVYTAASVVAAAPNSIHLCQDVAASAMLADVNAAFNLAQTGAGHLYEQAVAGYARKAVQLTDGVTGSWVTTDAALPDVSTASALIFMVAEMPAIPANTRQLCTIGTTTNIAAARINITTGFQSGLSISVAANGANNIATRIMPVWLQLDRTNSTVKVLNDVDAVISPAFQAGMTGKSMRIGSAGTGTSAAKVLYAAMWHGANAEMAQATIKAITQTLGWPVSGF